MTTWTGLTNYHHELPYSLLIDKAPLRKAIRRMMRRKGMRFLREQLDTLIGAAAGSAMSDTYAQADGSEGFTSAVETDSEGNSITVTKRTDDTPLGGSRTINSVSLATGNTTAAQVTDLKTFLVPAITGDITYASDLSGNGGGGKLGY